jgi:hypothetical protein
MNESKAIELGNKIYDARRRSGYSKNSYIDLLAERTGRRYTDLYLFETVEKALCAPSDTLLEAMCTILDLDFDEVESLKVKAWGHGTCRR